MKPVRQQQAVSSRDGSGPKNKGIFREKKLDFREQEREY